MIKVIAQSRVELKVKGQRRTFLLNLLVDASLEKFKRELEAPNALVKASIKESQKKLKATKPTTTAGEKKRIQRLLDERAR
jgi:hypothetical protein